jgi:hypothetical protein
MFSSTVLIESVRQARLLLLVLASAVVCWSCVVVKAAEPQFAPWTTRSADNARSGWNAHETELTPAKIEGAGLVKLGVYKVPGDDRGLEAQPLVLPGVQTASGLRDVIVFASMGDHVRAVDARDGDLLWDVQVGMPVLSSKNIDMWGINHHWGCLSTGVIDQDMQRLYQVCWVLPKNAADATDASAARSYMFVFNLADGGLVVPPVLLDGASQGVNFNAMPRKQRSALVETNVDGVKTVFGCAGTVKEADDHAAGFCFAFDVATSKFSTLLALSRGISNNSGAGVWMGGQGVVADAAGDLYLITGNGGFDGVSSFGESFVKLRYQPPMPGREASLSVVGHWTPWTDVARAPPQTRLAAARAAMKQHPSGAMMTMSSGPGAVLKTGFDSRGHPLLLVFPNDPGRWSDEDWGSAGPACLFAIEICVATGKDGIGYPLRASDPGATTPADLADAKANCGKLAFPPVWLTIDLGAVDPCPADPRELNFLPQGETAHLHMTPVQYFDPLLGVWTIFVWGENSILRKWAVSPSDGLKLVAEGAEPASEDVRGADLGGGMPGGFCAGSSNGGDPESAILACTIPYGDGNQHVVEGRLLVYDAAHLLQGRLKVVFDSRHVGLPFKFNKFNPPLIDGGRIYVPDYDGGVEVFGLPR